MSAEDCDNPDAALTQAEWVELCATEGAPVTEPPTVGDTVDFVDSEGNGGRITLHGVSRTRELDDPDPYGDTEVPEQGWLLVDVTVEATAGQVQVGVLNFSVWDADGVQYQATFDNIAREKEWLPDAILQASRPRDRR